jgi:hypothetical protein
MAESPDRMGRFRRIVSFAADVGAEEDVAKERLAGTKACYRKSRVSLVWESLKW